MLSPRGQRGLEDKIFGLGLVAFFLGLVLVACNAGLVLSIWPRPYNFLSASAS